MFKLDEKPIKRIGWELTDCMPDNYNIVEVGTGGVTCIDTVLQYLGEYQICWFQVWKKENLIARYNARNVDSITYEDE